MAYEYIRKADAVEALDGKIIVTGSENADAVLQYMKDISNKIKSLEPADVVPVVRCKDCRYRVDPDKCCHPDGLLRSKDSDFCSYGERCFALMTGNGQDAHCQQSKGEKTNGRS